VSHAFILARNGRTCVPELTGAGVETVVFPGLNLLLLKGLLILGILWVRAVVAARVGCS
jgi:hypothetical protein